MRRLVASSLLMVSLLVAPGCDQQEESGAYVDGQSEMTNDEAFSVTLSHEDGEPNWGMNTFTVRVAMPDPSNPDSEGKGIPGAEIDVAAWMNGVDHQMDVLPTVTYEGDGVYRVEGVLLDSAGDWSLDVQITIGSLTDSARFSFQLEA